MRRSWRRRQILPLIAAVALVAAGATVQLVKAEEARSDVEQEALDFVKSLTDVYRANDVDGYLGHYAKNLTWWGPGGRSSWDAYHESWTKNVATTGGVASAELSDEQVHVSSSGDAAVVSFLWTNDYFGEGGSVRTSRFQMSTSLMKRDGNWKIVHLHFSRPPEQE